MSEEYYTLYADIFSEFLFSRNAHLLRTGVILKGLIQQVTKLTD
jgi:hypothetical protein